jgi:regulatory protein
LDRAYFARRAGRKIEVIFSMAVITAVEKTGPVYRIYADGRLMARVDRACFERLPLNAGDEVDEADYLAALDRFQRPLAYEAALSALERSGKSEKALRRWLGLRGYQEGAIDEAVGRLLRARLLDDAAEAARLVETAVSGGLSRRAIQRKLYARGIDADDADAALAAVNDEDQLAAAEKLARKIGPRYAALESRAARAKLSQALARRGFSWDVIDRALSDRDE